MEKDILCMVLISSLEISTACSILLLEDAGKPASSDCEKTDFLQKTILLKYILRLTGALSGSV